MSGSREDRGYSALRGEAANDNGGAEVRLDTAVMTLARICAERAEREGWKIAGAYKYSAVSGSSVILRPGVQALLEDAALGKFDVVLAEALGRVSRDQADVAVLYKHLRFAGVGIFTLTEGEIDEFHVGLVNDHP